LPARWQHEYADFSRRLLTHEDREIGLAVAVEVAALIERVDAAERFDSIRRCCCGPGLRRPRRKLTVERQRLRDSKRRRHRRRCRRASPVAEHRHPPT
jgi:hypothetical protein